MAARENGRCWRSRTSRRSSTRQDGVVKAVNGVSFTLNEGEALGLVGESGCGKSVSALSLMRLIPTPPGRIVEGEVIFDGRDLLKLNDDDMRQVRGNDIAMIFQDPMTSLNPVLTIGRQISEALELHKGMDRAQARKRTIELLELVGIPAARSRVDDYPHQFSGGMRQRVMIAMALSLRPEAAARRRADHRARRDDPGPDPGPDQAAARRAGHGDHHDHPRPGRGRRASPTGSTSCTPATSSRPATADEIFHNPRHPYTLGLLKLDPAPRRAAQGEARSRSRACRRTWSTRRRAARSSRAARTRSSAA